MPAIQGLSKAAANYRRADNPKFSCHECKFMLPRLAIGGCRFVRGVIRGGHLRRVRVSVPANNPRAVAGLTQLDTVRGSRTTPTPLGYPSPG